MHRVLVKIEGLREPATAVAVAELGADFIGLVFAPSPRRVTVEQAAEIVAALPPSVETIGVFVNETAEEINRVIAATGIGRVQLHGDEGPEMVEQINRPCIKAFRVRDAQWLDEASKWLSGLERGVGLRPARPVGVPPAANQPQPTNNPLECSPIEKREGHLLPHWTKEGATYAVTFRLADALPHHVVEGYRREREDLLRRAHAQSRDLTEQERRELYRLHSTRIEAVLDAGAGACFLKNPAVAEVVLSALKYFEGERYHLIGWCVMPNHVHVIVSPLGGHELKDIVQSWKSFTAKEANKVLHRQGAFWQPEYYDHLIRDEEDFIHSVNYLMQNPQKANLHNWPYCGLAAEWQEVQDRFWEADHMVRGPEAHTTLGRDAQATEEQATLRPYGQAAEDTRGQDAHATLGPEAQATKEKLAVLLDAYNPSARGGTGERFNWRLVSEAREAGRMEGLPPIVLAGGLDPECVAEAIRVVRPWAVDVASGVEFAPGVKDLGKVKAFIDAVRAEERGA